MLLYLPSASQPAFSTPPHLLPHSLRAWCHTTLPAYSLPPCSGSKFKKLVAKRQAEEALPRYEPFLVPSINFPDKLYCALTNQVITRNMDAVKQHMKGKRFQKAKGERCRIGQAGRRAGGMGARKEAQCLCAAGSTAVCASGQLRQTAC